MPSRHAGRHRFKGLALGKLRQGRVCGLPPFPVPPVSAPCGRGVPLPSIRPARRSFPFAVKEWPCAVQNRRHRLKPVRLGRWQQRSLAAISVSTSRSPEGSSDRSVRAISHRRDNGMVVGDFAAVRYAVNIRFLRCSLFQRAYCSRSQRTREAAVACISSVRYWLSVRG